MVFPLLCVVSLGFSQSDGMQRGKLIIVGGGSMADSLYHIFGQLAGGKDKQMVIIPTAMSDEAIAEYKFKDRFEKLGFSGLQRTSSFWV